LYDNIIKKYYGSAFFALSCGKTKPIHFFVILESKLMDDSFMRGRAEASIKKRLPFKLQQNPEILNVLIENFKICSIPEWNELYPMFAFKKRSTQN